MGNSMKKSNPVARQQVARELTPEQKQEAIKRFFTQKRESFTTGILFNLCKALGREIFYDKKSDDSRNVHLDMVDTAVAMADHLLEKLYPLKEESETVEAE